MKLTKSKLIQLINEEIKRSLNEEKDYMGLEFDDSPIPEVAPEEYCQDNPYAWVQIRHKTVPCEGRVKLLDNFATILGSGEQWAEDILNRHDRPESPEEAADTILNEYENAGGYEYSVKRLVRLINDVLEGKPADEPGGLADDIAKTLEKTGRKADRAMRERNQESGGYLPQMYRKG